MPDWKRSMKQTYEFYEVNPITWKDQKKLNNVKSCTITRDSEVETLGSATFDITESVGECYIRVYLITEQDGIREKHPLGTFLVQTPASSFDGKVRSVSMDAYTPLLELKENPPPLGYSILKHDPDNPSGPTNIPIMEHAYKLVGEHARAPVVKPDNIQEKLTNDFVANTDDTWLSYLTDLVASVKGEGTTFGYKFALDELGQIMFTPKQDITSLRPIWAYDDSNSSILYPELNMDHDLYGIPNVVEVAYSDYHIRVENRDPNSPTSINKRGREITHRIVDPDLVGYWTKKQIVDYAKQTLIDMSTVQYRITYSHGYCPVRLDDCIRLNYSRAGLNNMKGKVISQIIKCVNGCPVTEKAVFTVKLLSGKMTPQDVTQELNTYVIGGDE